MTHDRFDLDAWLPRLPLRASNDRYSGEPVTGPAQICNNEHLRRALKDEIDWGASEPVDIFVMAQGEPEIRHVTKIGGVPYRPAGVPWPTAPDGQPMTFLGQFCFADSRDLAGDLPGDVLLVFAWATETERVETPVFVQSPGITYVPRLNEVFPDALHFEWHQLGLRNLVQPEEMPPRYWRFEPCYGHICRTTSWPQAKRRRQDITYLQVDGLEVWSDHWLWQYQATQIGGAPFHVQEHPQLPGRPLCALSSVCPSPWSPYPWINRAEPLYPEGEIDVSDNSQLALVDTGCIYISIDNDVLHWNLECF